MDTILLTIAWIILMSLVLKDILTRKRFFNNKELDYPIRKRKGSQRWGARNR